MIITSLGESTKEKESLADGDFNGPYASFGEPDSSKMTFSCRCHFRNSYACSTSYKIFADKFEKCSD